MVKRNNDKWSALSMTERADLINTYIQNGVLDLKKMREHYNSFGDGGDTWEKVDKFVEKAEPWVSGTSLAATGTALAISAASGGTAAPVALPVAATIGTISNGAGVLIDGYQSVRALTEGDYKKALGNGIEAVLGSFGGKYAAKLAKTKGGRAIGKLKERLVQERFANSGEKIARLMRKGLTYEEAAEQVFKNAVNYVDNSSKVKDIATSIQDAHNKKFEKAAQIVDAVFDVKDTGIGIYNSFKEEHPVEIYKFGGKLNKLATGGRILDGTKEEEQTLSGEVPILQEKNTVLNAPHINFLPQNTIREAYNNKDVVHTIGNWLNNRREQLYNNMQQMYADGKVPESFFGLPFFETPFYLENDKNKEINQEINRQLNKVEQADYEEKLLPLFTQGLYDIKNNKVLLSTTLDEGSYEKDVIKLHEFLHASGYNSPQEYVIAQYFKDRQGDKYILDPSEIYARLGTFRKMFNIDPNHKYTLEDVKSLRSQLKKDYGDSYFIKLSKPFNDKIHKLKAEHVSRNIPEELKTMWWWKGDEDFKKNIYSDPYYLNQIIEDYNIELPQEIELIKKEKEKAIEKYKKGKSVSEIRAKDFDGVMWMDNFSDEDMVFLLNEVAQNTTDGTKLNYVNPDNIAALGGPLYNEHNPIESFSGSSKIPSVRYDDGGILFNTPYPTQYYDEYVANSNPRVRVIPDAPINENEIVRRQAWAESAGNDRAGSPKGAKGRYQIMPDTLTEYQQKTGNIGDVYDPVYNRKVRDWEFNRYKNSQQVNRGEPTDSVKMGRRLAIYNYGYGNVRKALNKADSLGIDIDSSFNWLNVFPKETEDYVNFILRNKDTGVHRTNKAYKNRKK